MEKPKTLMNSIKSMITGKNKTKGISKKKTMKSIEGLRSFTINNAYHVDGCPTKFSHKDYTGRILSKHPMRAASKTLTRLCHVKKIRGQCTLYIELRETTAGSSGKLYSYHCKRFRLKNPIQLNNKTIYYMNKCKKVDIPKEKCVKSHKSSGRKRSYLKLSKYKSKSHKSKKNKTKSKSKTK